MANQAVLTVLRDVCQRVLGSATYQHAQVSDWSSEIMKGVLEGLPQGEKPVKHIVSVTIVQKKGEASGLHMSVSARWNSALDSAVTHRHETATLTAAVTVYIVSME